MKRGRRGKEGWRQTQTSRMNGALGYRCGTLVQLPHRFSFQPVKNLPGTLANLLPSTVHSDPSLFSRML